MSYSIIAKTPPIESTAKENANAEETPIEAASQKPLPPGNLREPGVRRAAVRVALGATYRSGERKSHCVFSSDLKKKRLSRSAMSEQSSQK